MAYSVEAFGLRLVPGNLLSPMSETTRNRAREPPGSFGQSCDSQANMLQDTHEGLSILHSMLLSVRHSTLHKAHDFEEDSDHPRLRSLWVFFSGWSERSRVVFEFLVTMRARICV